MAAKKSAGEKKSSAKKGASCKWGSKTVKTQCLSKAESQARKRRAKRKLSPVGETKARIRHIVSACDVDSVKTGIPKGDRPKWIKTCVRGRI